VSESYRRLHRMLMRQGRSDSRNGWKQAVDQLRRADWFIQSIRMRRRTLQQVAEAVVEIHRPFLDTGLQEKLRPLTRAKVALLLGKHESTISRATANKYVFLPSPSSRVVGFDIFFKPSLSPKSIIEDIIRRESAGSPLTDMQICQLLSTRGFNIARRTVAKYRLALRIPSSEQRGRR
jgi:RNA polymerase sigma-54 factor